MPNFEHNASWYIIMWWPDPVHFTPEHSKTTNILLLKYMDSRLFFNEPGYEDFCVRKTQNTVKRESFIIEVTMVDERFH